MPLEERLLGRKGAGSQAVALQPGKSDKQKGKGFQKTGKGRWGAAKLGSLPNDGSQAGNLWPRCFLGARREEERQASPSAQNSLE